jgi:hypothetical protein
MHELTYKLNRQLERAAVQYSSYLPRIAALLAVVFALSIFLYGIFLLEAVAQAASKTTAERQIESLSSQLGVLEGKYLSATQSLTPGRAEALGYVAPATVSTVVLSAPSALSFGGR